MKDEKDKALDNLMAWQQEFEKQEAVTEKQHDLLMSALEHSSTKIERKQKPVAWMTDDGKIVSNREKEKYDITFGDYCIPLYTAPIELSDGCGNCHACLVGVMENNIPVTSQRMIVCSDCGNKRCPKASNHRHKCTGSNEVGQYGSIYTAPRELSDEEIQTIDKLLDLCWNFSVSGVYFHEFQENVEAVEKVEAILKKASEK